MRQRILGVVHNVIHRFVESLTRFTAVEEFRKFRRNYRHKRVARFLGHGVPCSAVA